MQNIGGYEALIFRNRDQLPWNGQNQPPSSTNHMGFTTLIQRCSMACGRWKALHFLRLFATD